MINVIEVAHMAQDRMVKYKELGSGVSMAMKSLPKSYNGDYKGLASYLNDKISMTVNNAIDTKTPNYSLGKVALYSEMIKICLEKDN